MLRKPRGGFASDKGMSIVEVAISAVILFFVITAVLSLMFTSTRMGVDAKQRTAVTNAISSHLEWIRSLDYSQVAITGNGSGVIDPSMTEMVEGYTVVIATTITEGTNVKEVQVDGTATREGHPTLTLSEHASIRDYKSGVTQVSEVKGPLIDFTSLTPIEDSVIYSQYVQGGAALNIAVNAKAQMPDATIDDLRFYCSGQLLRDGSSVHAQVAAWQPFTATVSKSFSWDTEQVDDAGQPGAIADGYRIVRVEATDSLGQAAFKERRFYVDNYAPGNPGTPVVPMVNSDVEVRLSWPQAMDGTNPTWEYGLKIGKVDSTGNIVITNPVNVDGVPQDYIVTPPAYIHTTTAFSRYLAQVRAYSPRMLTSDYVPAAPGVRYVSKPLLTGTSITTYSGRNASRIANTAVDVAVTPPTFGTSQLVYDLFRSTNPADMGSSPYLSNTTPTYHDAYQTTVGRTGTPTLYYYRYRITYAASGSTAAGTEVAWSNIIGPTTTTSVSTPMPFVSW